MGEKLLTVIIPFLNEGDEVGRTVASVLEFADGKVDIIVINDGSSPLHDYEAMLRFFSSVRYVSNGQRLGVTACRDMGVEMARTPYFILLDAHMRFYRHGWVDRIVGLLREDDRRIFCCQTKALERDDSDEVVPMRTKTPYGARICLRDDEKLLDPKWICPAEEPHAGQTVIDVPCVLGATYATSRRYWKRIRGYEGLRLYGHEEPYISMKTWLEGGRCQLIKDIEVGHIYRTRFPYKVASDEMMHNRMIIATLLMPERLRQRVYDQCRSQDEVSFSRILDDFAIRHDEIDALRLYYRSVSIRTFDFIERMNSQGI